MSYEDGWAAINLQAPPRVPRTEYSTEGHWALLRAVTDIAVDGDSPPAVKRRARRAFWSAWNFDFHWTTTVGGDLFGDYRTHMGHAEYADGGVDRSDFVNCPFKSPEAVLSFDPFEAYGTPDHSNVIRRFEDAYAAERALHPDGVLMTGIYTTLVSGLIDIFGWDMLLLAAGTDPVGFGDLATRYAAWIQNYFDALADADVPIVMVHDDIVWTGGPFMHPDWYRAHVFPHYADFLAPLIESGKKIAYTSDGDYSIFIDDIAACGVHGFVMEPMTDMAYIAERYGHTHFFIGNADTRVLLRNDRAAIRAEVERCMSIGKGCPGFFMAVGNHIPANTPVEACLYYNDVYEELSRR